MGTWVVVAVLGCACQGAAPEDAGGGGDEGSGDEGGGPGDPALVSRLPLEARTADCFDAPDGETVDKLVDGSTSSKFLARRSTVWIELDTGEPRIVSRYVVTAGNDAPERDPVRWVLQGSNDGRIWETIDVRKGLTFGRGQQRSFELPDNDRFYRFYLISMENSSGGATQLAELEMLGFDPFELDDETITEPPAAPIELTANALDRDDVELRWTDQSDSEVWFRIEHSTDGETWTTLSMEPPNTDSYLATRMAPADNLFRISAENSAGASPVSSSASATTTTMPGTAQEGGVLYADRGYELLVNDIGGEVDDEVEQRMIGELFDSYPDIAESFNPGAPTRVRLTFDPAYDGAPSSSGDQITIAPSWAPNTGVIVYQGARVAQSYSATGLPAWAIQGLADYARYQYGHYNRESCFVLTRYTDTQNYDDGYRVSARFFLWIDQVIAPNILYDLDRALRAGDYSPEFWVAHTDLTIDELWSKYAADAHDPLVYR